jgi:hypothetical protein
MVKQLESLGRSKNEVIGGKRNPCSGGLQIRRQDTWGLQTVTLVTNMPASAAITTRRIEEEDSWRWLMMG